MNNLFHRYSIMSSENANHREAYRAPSVHTVVKARKDLPAPQDQGLRDLVVPEIIARHTDEPMADLTAPRDDGFQDLLNPTAVTNDQDLPMLDFEEESTEEDEPDEELPTTIKEEEVESDFAWTSMQDAYIELSDNEQLDSDSDLEILQVTEKPRTLIDLSVANDGHQVRVKQEPQESDLPLSDIANNIVPDDGEEDVVVLGNGVKVPVKKEGGDVEFLWSKMSDDVIELPDSDDESPIPTRSTLGHSFLGNRNPGHRRQPADLQRMRDIQQMIANRAIQKRRAPGGASHIFSVPRGYANGNANYPSTGDDANAWMHATIDDDDDSVSNFLQIKRVYKAKKKAKKTTLEDDVAFKKAQDKERARLKRLEAKFRRSQYQLDSEEDEAEESDDGLFVPDNTSRRSAKRSNPAVVEIEDDEDTPASKKSGPKRRKPYARTKRTQAELEKDELANMMAGWEERGLKPLVKRDDEDPKAKTKYQKGAKKAAKKDTQKGKGKKGKASNPNAKYTEDLLGGKQPGRRSKKHARNIVESLTASNVYDDANANLKKTAIPVLTGTRKKEAMANLIASVPLDESKVAQAITDKNAILKATKILGKCSVARKKVEDERAEKIQDDDLQEKEGAWELKGMTSALFHHQVQGAAKMKEREIGVDEPLGGILADSMGFGKTLMVIAAMISNPPEKDEEHRSTLIICSPAVISQWDQEIDKHTDDSVFLESIKHHGITRLSNKGKSGRRAMSKMESADIVLSTYSELVKSYPKCHVPENIKEPAAQFAWWRQEWDTKRDMLHRAHFYRVVLDGKDRPGKKPTSLVPESFANPQLQRRMSSRTTPAILRLHAEP